MNKWRPFVPDPDYDRPQPKPDLFFFRANALQKRHFERAKGGSSGGDGSVGGGRRRGDEEGDRVRLLGNDDDDDDIEAATGGKSDGAVTSTPSYASVAEELEYELSKMLARVSDLDNLHKSLASRPTFDDLDNGEDKQIENLTKEITAVLGYASGKVKALQRSSAHYHGAEAVIVRNLVLSMSQRLQAVTESFRRSQSSFLKKMNARDERSKEYFEDFDVLENEMTPVIEAGKISTQELLMLEESIKYSEEREREVQNIGQSIQGLNTIFVELAQLVSEQGALVDRIDQSVEAAQVRVEEGTAHLKKAAEYKNKSRKKKLILLAIFIVFLLLVILLGGWGS